LENLEKSQFIFCAILGINHLTNMLDNRDKLWIGLLIGLVVPFVGYAIILMILEALGASESLAEKNLNFDFKERTLALLALALNLIPMRIFMRKYMNKALRGLVLATLVYGLVWMVYFGSKLLEV
jgi:dolichyl-phosphate-mannose--protein O-mannosyl transferase